MAKVSVSLLSRLLSIGKETTYLWVIGCPRSGTTYLTRLLGDNADLMLNEPNKIPMYARNNVENWTFPPCRTVVFKWCENWMVAEKILARFPNSYFFHTIRDPLNNIYSIAFPKVDSFPSRPCLAVGETEEERIDNAIKRWFHYTKGCLSVKDLAGTRYLPVLYENITDFFPLIEETSGLDLKKKTPFVNRNIAESGLVKINERLRYHPYANQLLKHVLRVSGVVRESLI